MLTYYEEAACGRVTRATSIRLRKQLTWKGLESYWKGLDEGLSPRQSLHKIIVNCRQKEKAWKQKALEDFITYGLPVAKMTVKEFIEANGRDAHNRWSYFSPAELKRILKNWRAKSLDEAVSNYVSRQLELVAQNEDFAFRFQHVDLITQAIEFGLEYNPEAFNYYKKLNLFI